MCSSSAVLKKKERISVFRRLPLGDFFGDLALTKDARPGACDGRCAGQNCGTF